MGKKLNDESLEKINGGYFTDEAEQWLNRHRDDIWARAIASGRADKYTHFILWIAWLHIAMN